MTIQIATALNDEVELQDLRSAAEKLVDYVETDLREQAEELARSLSPGSLMLATILLLQMEARHLWRARTLVREREAEQLAREARKTAAPERTQPPPVSDGHTGRFSKGSWNNQNRCKCDECAAARTEKDEWEFAHLQKKIEAIVRYEGELRESFRMEWTEELLSAGFALPDGETVAWGEATVEQHQLRVDMLRANVMANADASIRHVEAIEKINKSGVRTLNEALENSI